MLDRLSIHFKIISISRLPSLGFVLSALAMLGSVVSTGVISYHNKINVGLQIKPDMTESTYVEIDLYTLKISLTLLYYIAEFTTTSTLST